MFAPCDLQPLFFALSVLFFIIGSTCAMGKNVNGTSIHRFFHQKLIEIHVNPHVAQSYNFYFLFFKKSLKIKKNIVAKCCILNGET
jgi:hypothetical protein